MQLNECIDLEVHNLSPQAAFIHNMYIESSTCDFVGLPTIYLLSVLDTEEHAKF